MLQYVSSTLDRQVTFRPVDNRSRLRIGARQAFVLQLLERGTVRHLT